MIRADPKPRRHKAGGTKYLKQRSLHAVADNRPNNTPVRGQGSGVYYRKVHLLKTG